MSRIETVRPRREKAEWNIADLGVIASTVEGITSAIGDTRRVAQFSALELDALLPVDLERLVQNRRIKYGQTYKT